MPKELTDEMIAQACEEVDNAIIEQLEKEMEGQPPHQFSPEFEAKMASLFAAVKRHEGTGTVPIWDEDTQRYI